MTEKGDIGIKHVNKIMLFVIDTSAITDPRLRIVFDVKTIREVVEKLIIIFQEFRMRLGPIFYTTPTIQNELRKYLINNNVPEKTVKDFEAWIVAKSPDKLTVKIPAFILWEYVDNVRKRFMKGLRLAEEMIRRTALAKKDEIPTLIRLLREKYRESVRKGIIDSPEDLDIVLLAYELKGVLVTNDEGIVKMAHSMGIITIDPLSFIDGLYRMKNLLLKEEEKMRIKNDDTTVD